MRRSWWRRAKALGLAAIAVTDRNTLAGVVRAHLAAREIGGIKFIVGARLDLQDAPSLLAYPTDRAAYGRLCRLLTLGQRRSAKGKCTLHLADVAAHAEGLIFIALPPDHVPPSPPLSSPGLTGRSTNHAKVVAFPLEGKGDWGRLQGPPPERGRVAMAIGHRRVEYSPPPESRFGPPPDLPLQGEVWCCCIRSTSKRSCNASSKRWVPDAALPRRQSFLSRRRPRPHRMLSATGDTRRPSPRRHWRRALSRHPPPALARRAHLHPREMHDP